MMKLPQLDKLLAKVSKLSKREKLVLFGSILAVACALSDRLIVASLSRKIKEQDTRIAAREAEIRKNLKIVSQKKRITAQHDTYKPYLGTMSSENEEFTVFLKEMDTLARDSTIYVVDMKPTGTKESGEAKKYLINLNIEADMASLIRFMYSVEDSKKLMTVEKYQISPKSKDSPTAKCSMLVSKLVIPL